MSIIGINWMHLRKAYTMSIQRLSMSKKIYYLISRHKYLYYSVRKEIEEKGLNQNFIHRDKKTHTFYMYSGKDFQDKSHRFLMMGKFLPKLNEFRIYLMN
jgi:L-rhamnose mutarotase